MVLCNSLFTAVFSNFFDRISWIDLITEAGQLSGVYDAIVLCVNHNEFKTLNIEKPKKEKSVVFDVKGCLDQKIVDDRL